MKQTVYLITDESIERFMCRNTKGRYYGIPKNIKDIIKYPTKGSAQAHIDMWNYCRDSEERESMVVDGYTITLTPENEHINF